MAMLLLKAGNTIFKHPFAVKLFMTSRYVLCLTCKYEIHKRSGLSIIRAALRHQKEFPEHSVVIAAPAKSFGNFVPVLK